jgi:hypothetical protein
MHRQHLTLGIFALGLLALPFSPAWSASRNDDYGGKDDAQVCYAVKKGYDRGGHDDTRQRVVLDVLFHSHLDFPGGFPQSVYDADGKYVDGSNYYRPSMAVADGAVVVTNSYERKSYRPPKYKSGARLGLEVYGQLYGTRNFILDCTSTEESPTPKVWYCKDVNLEKLDYPDENCGFFQPN